MEAGEGASLGGASPQRFVSGLAQDLGRHTVVTLDCKLHQSSMQQGQECAQAVVARVELHEAARSAAEKFAKPVIVCAAHRLSCHSHTSCYWQEAFLVPMLLAWVTSCRP